MTSYNHSQMEEAEISSDKLRDKRLRLEEDRVIGRETPLGHSYSVILEELARNDLDATPDPDEFLNFVAGNLRSRGEKYQVEGLSLDSPTYFPYITYCVLKYRIRKGLDTKTCSKVMFELVGKVGQHFTEEYIDMIYFRKLRG